MSTPDIEAWFDTVPALQRKGLVTLRALIKSLRVSVVEELKWGRPCYSTTRGLFCYLHSTKNYATLGFQNGTSLNDPGKLLEGTGKAMRHIKLRGKASLNKRAVLSLLKQAAER
jgi:hypothetical protein